MKQEEISYDSSQAYPAYGAPKHNEKPAGEGSMPVNMNTAQSVEDMNAWNGDVVKKRQTDTFDPSLAASWNGSYKPKGS